MPGFQPFAYLSDSQTGVLTIALGYSSTNISNHIGPSKDIVGLDRQGDSSPDISFRMSTLRDAVAAQY
jgi:hypothetical protein